MHANRYHSKLADSALFCLDFDSTGGKFLPAEKLVAEQLSTLGWPRAHRTVMGGIESSWWEPDFILEVASPTEAGGWVAVLSFAVQVSGGTSPSWPRPRLVFPHAITLGPGASAR